MKLFYKEKIGNKRTIHILGMKISYKKKSKHPIFRILKQDKTSQVEFYLIDSFEIFHYLPIYKECLKQGIRARIVAEPCDINTSSTWFDYDSAVKILKENKIKYCTKCNPNAKIAITTQRADLLSKYRNLKINISYGFGFTNDYFINSKEAIEGFDVKFVHGKYPKKLIEQHHTNAKIFIFGYPKYQDFLHNPPLRNKLLKELGVDTTKKILTYFPTWDNDSSIQKFSEIFKELKKEFFIITKPHHCTCRLADKKDDLRILYENSDIVLDGNYDFAKSTLLGDIALCDIKSGASCEVAYLNKTIPIILLSPHENLERYNPIVQEYFDIVKGPKYLKEKISNINQDSSYREKINKFIEEIYEEVSVETTVGFLNNIISGSKL